MPAPSPLLRRRVPAALAVVVLPLTALVGCGQAEQSTRSSVEAELRQAGDHLLDSESTTVTISLDDAKGTAKAAITNGPDAAPEAVADALLGGSVSFTIDPASGKTLRDLQSTDPATPPAESLKLVNMAFSVDADGGPLVQVRLVGGDLYTAVDLERIGGLADKAGEPDFSAQVDEFARSAPPDFQPLVADLQDGKWVRLPLAEYADQLNELGSPPAGAPSPDPDKLASDLLAAVRPFVEVTDAGDKGDQRILDVRVQAREALKALFDVVGRSVPGLDQLPAQQLDTLAAGTVDGKVFLEDSHLTKLSLDLSSIARVSPDGSTAPDLTGSTLTVSVDDSADEVEVPEDLSSVDVGVLVEQFLGSLTGSVGA